MKARHVFVALFARSGNRRSPSAASAAVAALALALTLGVPLAAAAPPTATLDPVGTVSYTTAEVKGAVDPEDNETYYCFETALTADVAANGLAASWSGFCYEGNLAANEPPTDVPAGGGYRQLTGLIPGTEYNVRLTAWNFIDPEAFSTEETFTTLEVAAPDVSLEPVSALTHNSAHFSGEVDTNAPDSSDAFDSSWSFTCDPACGGTKGGTVLASTGSDEVANDVGLVPNTPYTVTLKATNAGGSDEASESFETPAITPTTTTLPAANVTDTAAKIRGKVNPNNSPTEYWLEWGSSNCSTSSCVGIPASQDADAGSVNHAVFVSRELTGLAPSTTYHYRLVAKNSKGTVAAEDATFTTTAPESSCRNAGRIGVGFLPGCRAWEMVSPPDKNGGDVTAIPTRTRAAADGSAAQFTSLAGFGDVAGMGVGVDYLAQRSSSLDPGNNGWATHGIIPSQESSTQISAVRGAEPRYVGELSPNLDRGVFSAWSPLTDAPNVSEAINLYFRDDLRTPGPGSFQLLTDSAFEIPEIADLGRLLPPIFVSASDDFRHFIYQSELPRLPGANFFEPNVYEWDRGTLQLASVLPNGEAAPQPVAGHGNLERPSTTSHPISADGRRIIFTDVTESKPDGVTRGALYLRIDGRSTVKLNASERAVPASPAPAEYWDASIDASHIFFTSGEALTEDAPPVGGAYMWERQETSEQQSVAIDASGGNFTLGFNGATTGAIDFDASATAVEQELEALNTVKPGNVTVSGGPGNAGAAIPYQVTFTGDFAGANVAELGADGSALTGGLASAEVTTTKPVENLTLLSRNRHTGATGKGEAVGVLGASRDGRYVYFASYGQLDEDAPAIPSQQGLYLWHDGEISYIGIVSLSDQELLLDGRSNLDISKEARVTPDGRHLLFATRRGDGLLSVRGGIDYDHGPDLTNSTQLYLYDADTDELDCVSCKPAGGPGTTRATGGVVPGNKTGGLNTGTHRSHSLSNDGRYAFFSTAEKLVAGDTNGVSDAYVYDNATDEPRLLSSGEYPSGSYFMDASSNGRDAFFVTSEPLSGWDVDGNRDLYDARVDGGFPEPPPLLPSCEGDACQPAPLALNDPTPSSATAQGPGNERRSNPKKPLRRCPKGKQRVKAANGKTRCAKRGSKKKRNANTNRRAGR